MPRARAWMKATAQLRAMTGDTHGVRISSCFRSRDRCDCITMAPGRAPNTQATPRKEAL